MSCHKNGGHLGVHQDNSPEYPTNRLLTYVYYFGIQPRQFSGGQLAIYNDSVISGYELKFRKHNSATIVEPENNTIVFFLSRSFHEVLKVSSDGSFANSRFSCHGWIRT
jgi:Rps23 Pro-64 3,4-dihydroxylase Tpa1-like proline 4-hydroxylase